MKHTIFLLIGLIVLLHTQAQPHYQWFEPRFVEGVCKPDSQHIYHRLPAYMEAQVRPVVWNLSLNTAGEFIHFRTTARNIIVRYTLASKNLNKPHMPSTGASGVDLYAMDRNGAWNWAAPYYTFGDTCVYAYKALRIAADKPVADFYLYLPLYNTVQWLTIGVPENNVLEFVPARKEQPIVAYGTSMMQGAVASRPGLTWTNILSRNLDRTVINLGFSGNGKYEKPIFDLMASVDAKMYILDCMPNLVNITEQALYDSLKYGVGKLREQHPAVPILLAEHAGGYMPFSIDTSRGARYEAASRTLAAVYKRLQADGVSHLYLLTDDEIGFDINSTVEGLHPSDIGMMKYAEAYEKKIREILHEPKGNVSTQIPIRQYRDGFDWGQRHEQVMKNMVDTHARVLLFGNSIINYWGGMPVPEKVAPRGEEAWQKYMQPRGVQNAGFGNDRIENVLWRIYHDGLNRFEGSRIVLMIGTNNLAVNTDEEIVNGLSFLARQIRLRKPHAKLLVAGILPRKGKEERVLHLNQLIKKMTTEEHCSFADLSQAFLIKDRINTDLFLPDGLHPNAAGYAVLGKQLSVLL